MDPFLGVASLLNYAFCCKGAAKMIVFEVWPE